MGARIWASFIRFNDFDNEAFAHEAVACFVTKGRRHLALLQPSEQVVLCYSHTRIGFQTGLHEYGAEEVPLRVTTDTALTDIRDTIEARHALALTAPDGIVCSSGGSAIAVNAGIEAAGFRLGRDIDMVAEAVDRRAELDPAGNHHNLRRCPSMRGRELAKARHRPHRRYRAGAACRASALPCLAEEADGRAKRPCR